MSKSIIFTLFEGNYEYGVGALINSAYKSGFKGKVIIGYKGALPFWFNQLKSESDKYVVPYVKDIEVEFVEVDTDLHLRYYKPFLFEQLFENYPNHKIFYFDPDITIIGDWDFFEDWASYGLAVVLDDCYPLMPHSHPIKQQWAKIYDYDLEKGVNFNFYINSGFIGCEISSLPLIAKWKINILSLVAKGHDLTALKPAIERTKSHKRLNPITGDQDILNATIIQNYHSTKISIVGSEGMGFIPAGYLMYHSTGKKTWNKNILIEFINNGNKITLADNLFLASSRYPLELYSSLNFTLKKLNFNFTKLLQRVF